MNGDRAKSPRRCKEKNRKCFFFFSSRSLHTRLQGDWSSDVCSSDLRTQADRNGVWHDDDAQILPDTRHGLVADLECLLEPRQAAAEQHHVGGLKGDIRAARDRNSHVGRRQGGCIVDAVAHHGDNTAGCLGSSYILRFFVREETTEGFVDSHCAREKAEY